MVVVVVEDVQPHARDHVRDRVILHVKDHVIVRVVVVVPDLVHVAAEDHVNIHVDQIVHKVVELNVLVRVDYLVIPDAPDLAIYLVQLNVHRHVQDHVLDNATERQVLINILGENKNEWYDKLGPLF